MSRHELETEEHLVIVGWDDRLQTFFGQVWTLPEGDDTNGPPEYWVGVRWEELPTTEHLIEALGDYATLPGEVVADLEEDVQSRRPLALRRRGPGPPHGVCQPEVHRLRLRYVTSAGDPAWTSSP